MDFPVHKNHPAIVGKAPVDRGKPLQPHSAVPAPGWPPYFGHFTSDAAEKRRRQSGVGGRIIWDALDDLG